MTFRELIVDFERAHMPTLAAPTRSKYRSLLDCHIKPAIADVEIEKLTTKYLDHWLAGKAEAGLSWATRIAMRNLVSSIFRRADIWGTYNGKNTATYARVGRRRSVYEKRKLTVEQTKKLLTILRPDVRLVCMVGLFCGLRISEVLGLCWKHVDFDRGMFLVRQRYWRGDVDRTKSEAADRDIPYGDLHDVLKVMYPSGVNAGERFCFDIRTQSASGITRDDRSIRRNFLRPAAESLGIYYPGFGFHSFRREAITAIAREAGPVQACLFAGHTRMDHTLLYGLDEYERQKRAIRAIQEPYVHAGLLKAM
jgi:integrase